MARQQIMLLPAQGDDTRRRPLLEDPSHGALLRRRAMDRSSYSTRAGERRRRMSELAGGTAAECAAVACCCPCGIVDLLVLAAYKVPAGLCRKALRKRHRRQAGKLHAGPDSIGLQTCHCCCDKVQVEIHPITNQLAVINALESDNNEVIELEKEMWDKFYSAGFWRSQSMRSEITDVSELTAMSLEFDNKDSLID